MKIALFGYGKMGKVIEKIAKKRAIKSYSRLMKIAPIIFKKS